MHIREVTEQNKQEYQSFVQANGSFLQYWEWGEFLRGRGRSVARFFVEQNGRIVASCQLLQHTVFWKIYFFGNYGPVFAPGSEHDLEKIIHAIADYIKLNYPRAVFLRLEPLVPLEHLNKLKLLMQSTQNIQPHKTAVLSLKLSEQQLLEKMHPKTRYNIKVAQKHGISVGVVDLSDEKKVFAALNLVAASAKRAKIRSYPRGYYFELLKFFEQQDKNLAAKLYIAADGADILAANIIIISGSRATYLFGGSAAEKRNLMAPYLLHWQCIRDAKASACEKYDFWGIEQDTKHPWFGFSRFKLGFGGEIIEYPGTFDYVLNYSWYNGYKVLRKLNRIIR